MWTRLGFVHLDPNLLKNKVRRVVRLCRQKCMSHRQNSNKLTMNDMPEKLTKPNQTKSAISYHTTRFCWFSRGNARSKWSLAVLYCIHNFTANEIQKRWVNVRFELIDLISTSRYIISTKRNIKNCFELWNNNDKMIERVSMEATYKNMRKWLNWNSFRILTHPTSIITEKKCYTWLIQRF